MRTRTSTTLALLALTTVLLAAPAAAQTPLPVRRLPIENLPFEAGISRLGLTPASDGLALALPPRSWRALRDAGVTRQTFDYSCGAAALATLLADAESDVDERSILDGVFDGLDETQRLETMREGLSLLDLQKAAELRGYRAEGYRVPTSTLAKIRRSVIVFIQPDGYRHFAVFRGVRGDRVFLADPARGNVRYPIWRFLEMWQDENGEGVVFITSKDEPPSLKLAMDAAPQPEIVAIRPSAPVGGGFVPSLPGPLAFEVGSLLTP